MPAPPGLEPNGVLKELRNLDRDPFLRTLADALENAPGKADYQTLASENPYRWAQTVKTLAALAGFSDKKQVSVDIYAHIDELTDAQLEDALEQLESGKIINITDYKVLPS